MFEEGERVLCSHGPLLYEAKIVAVELLRKRKYQYFIHYVGWNKSWDEWVPEDRLIECNDANLKEQQRLNVMHAKLVRGNRRRTSRKLNLAENLKPVETIEITDDEPCTKSNNASQPTPKTKIADINKVQQKIKIKEEPKDFDEVESENAMEVETEKNGEMEKGNVIKIEPKTEIDKTTEKIKKENDKLVENSSAEKCENQKPTTDDKIEFLPQTVKIEASSSTNMRKNWKKLITVQIPEMLKYCLYEDWRTVKCQKTLHKIPAKPTVHEIIKAYIIQKENSVTSSEDVVFFDFTSNSIPYKDLSNGIIRYFDMVLGTKLLYANEKEQYTKVLEDNPSMPVSHLYGAIHLLRLFVKIGPILETLGVNYTTMDLVISSIDDFIKFLDDNWEIYFPVQKDVAKEEMK